MSDSEATFTVNPARVVHETLDGEVILIQLERGNYYSLSGSGREIWDLLCQGLSTKEVVTRIEQGYSAGQVAVEPAVGELVRELLEEGLLEEGGPPSGTPGARSANGAGHGSQEEFEPANLEKYTDMQDYLLIDPIHDVTEAGWPTANQT